MSVKKISRQDMFSFARNGEASSIIGDVISFVGDNEIREMYDGDKRIGILLEKASYNLLPDSFNPTTRTISLSEGDYVFSAYGDGGATLDIDGDALTYNGIAISFTIDIPLTITITPIGSLTAFQLEPGSIPTSIIRTPVGMGAGRYDELLAHSRSSTFSRNTGSIIGQINIPQIEEGVTYVNVVGISGATAKITANISGNLVFAYEGQTIEFISPLPINGEIRYAIVYDAFQRYIRCYLNDEVGELSLDGYFTPEEVLFSDEISPTKMIVCRYEYRPKALTNGEVSQMLGHDFQLAYDFEVSPEQVNNWATLIFGASMYQFS